MRAIIAPHLEVQAIEAYIRRSVGEAATPAVDATQTFQDHGRVYVVVRRATGEVLAVYREESGDRLTRLRWPPRSLLAWGQRQNSVGAVSRKVRPNPQMQLSSCREC